LCEKKTKQFLQNTEKDGLITDKKYDRGVYVLKVPYLRILEKKAKHTDFLGYISIRNWGWTSTSTKFIGAEKIVLVGRLYYLHFVCVFDR